MKSFDVPDTIPLSKVRAFLADLGLPPVDGLRDLNIGIDGVHATFYAEGPDGKRYFDSGRQAAATHRIAIKLDRDA